jgi:hypothetical protein
VIDIRRDPYECEPVCRHSFQSILIEFETRPSHHHISARGVGKYVQASTAPPPTWPVHSPADSGGGGPAAGGEQAEPRSGMQGLKRLSQSTGSFQLACFQLRTHKVSILKCTGGCYARGHVIVAKFAQRRGESRPQKLPSPSLRSDVVTP